MNNKVRLYGNAINVWKAYDETKKREVITQYEVKYTEYNMDGTIYSKGSEDFSLERYRTLIGKWVYTWDGKKRNKGEKRKFDDMGYIKYINQQTKEVKELLKSKYPHAELIQLR